MKSMMSSWFCLTLAATSTISYANDAIEAYRKGHYIDAAEKLLKISKPDAIELDYLGNLYLYGYGVLKNNQLAIQNLTTAADKGYLPAQNLMARYWLIYEKKPDEALKWFTKAAENGDLNAQLYCIAAYQFGVGTKQNEDKAQRYEIMAAKQGNALAQASLAKRFIESRHTSNKRLGIAWLKRAMEQNEPAAQYLMANVYLEGKLEPRDLDQAKLLLDAAHAQGYLPAMQGLSELAKLSGDEVEAKTWKEKFDVASAQRPQGQEAEAALWLSHGKKSTFQETSYDFSGILTSWHDKNALTQNQYNQPPQIIGINRDAIYKPKFEMIKPNDIPLTAYYDVLVQSISKQDDASPIKAMAFPVYSLAEPSYSVLLEEKAALGDPTAQFALGQLYQQGISVKQDKEKAVSYYTQAIAQQDLKAEYTLGMYYLTGESGTPDYQQALGWLTDAAFKGNPESQYVLGYLFETGIKNDAGGYVIEPNHERAMAMYSLAAFNHLPEGEYRLAEMMVRDKSAHLNVQEKQKRYSLMKRLYQEAAAKGIQAAVLPLAFFDAMDSSKEKQAHAYQVAKEQAEAGNEQGMLLYGMLLDRGIGTTPDSSEAMKWYEKTNTNPISAFILGTYYAMGHEVTQNIETARTLLQKGSEANFSYADYNLAIFQQQQHMPFVTTLEKAHQNGNHDASLLLADYALANAEDSQAINQAKIIYQTLAERGLSDAQLKLGYLFEQGLAGKRNYEEAAHWYTLAGNQGNPIAQYLLGRLNQMGYLEKMPNYEVSKTWYQKAKASYAPAAVALGFIYETIDYNYDQALSAYTLATQQNSVVGEFDLALMYEYGKGCPVNLEKAESLYLKAAEKGHTAAMVQLGNIYLQDTGKLKNEKKAREWYEKAAKKGDRDALYQLGQMAENGQGMAKDREKAVAFYQQSAEKGNAKARLALAQLHESGHDSVTQDAENTVSFIAPLTYS